MESFFLNFPPAQLHHLEESEEVKDEMKRIFGQHVKAAGIQCLSTWIYNQRNMNEFPISLFNCTMEAWKHPLPFEALVKCRGIAGALSIFNSIEAAFLRSNFASLVARALINYFDGRNKDTDLILSDCLKKNLGDAEFEAKFKEDVLFIIKHVFEYGLDKPELIDSCLGHIAAMFKYESVVELLEPIYISQVLLIAAIELEQYPFHPEKFLSMLSILTAKCPTVLLCDIVVLRILDSINEIIRNLSFPASLSYFHIIHILVSRVQSFDSEKCFAVQEKLAFFHAVTSASHNIFCNQDFKQYIRENGLSDFLELLHFTDPSMQSIKLEEVGFAVEFRKLLCIFLENCASTIRSKHVFRLFKAKKLDGILCKSLVRYIDEKELKEIPEYGLIKADILLHSSTKTCEEPESEVNNSSEGLFVSALRMILRKTTNASLLGLRYLLIAASQLVNSESLCNSGQWSGMDSKLRTQFEPFKLSVQRKKMLFNKVKHVSLFEHYSLFWSLDLDLKPDVWVHQLTNCLIDGFVKNPLFAKLQSACSLDNWTFCESLLPLLFEDARAYDKENILFLPIQHFIRFCTPRASPLHSTMLKTAVSIVEKLLVQRPIASLDNLDFKALGTTLMDTDIDKVRSLYFFEMGIWSDEYLTEEDLKTLSDLYDGIGALDYAGAFEGSSKYKSIDIFKLISNGHDKTDLDSARSQSLWELQQWDLKSIPDGFRLDQNMVDLYSILRDVALDVEVSEKLERLSWIGSRLTSIDADPLKCKAINTCVSLANEQPRRLWDLDNCDQFDLALISLDPKKKSEQCELSAILLGRAQKANSIGDFKHISGQIQNLIKGNFIEEEDSIEYSGMLLVLKGEQAKFLWEKGKQEEAIELMKSGLFAMPNCPINDVFLREYTSLAFSQVGEWVFSTKSERPLAIKENYLDASLKVIGGFPSNPRTLAKIYSTYAKFVDHLFDQMSSSENLEFREKLLKQAKADVEALARLASSRRDDQALRSALKSMEQQYLADSKEFKEIERARTSFLLLAVENYLRCLQLVDTYDLSVFRICALWFEHYGKVMEVSKLISNALGKVACHKFLPLIYQLAARAELSETKQAEQEAFQDTLERLLMRMASKHPYHCVYQILALKAGSMGNKTGPAKRRLVYAGESLEDRRAAAAASLIGKLKGSDARVSRIVTAIERVCEGYIELADVELDASETKPNVLIPFDAKWTIRKLGSCPDVGIPTRSIPVDPSGAYADLVSIAGFGEGFKVVGGINLPKIIECLGSDGRSYRQLVKGKDDVRQVNYQGCRLSLIMIRML